MQPIKERGPVSYFNKYEPGTKIGKLLGNTQKGDGYRFKGEGHVQNTGRRNAAFASKRLNEVFGLNIDLVKNPEKRGDPFSSAQSLFLATRRAGGPAGSARLHLTMLTRTTPKTSESSYPLTFQHFNRVEIGKLARS
jgi:hypothetical protein